MDSVSYTDFFFCHGKIKRHWYLPWVFSAKFRLGLAEFLKSSYLFFHGQCLLHWSMSLPTFQVHWEKYQQSRKSVDRYHANQFQRTQPFDQICLKVRSKDVVRKLVSVNAFRSTVNTYLSDIFGPWLLLDQKHLYGARQRFCRGNRL